LTAARAQLERLGAQCGIASGFHDIWGNWREVPDASLAALLAAFGLDTSTTERAEAAGLALAAERWRTPLPPVAAIGEGRAPWRLRLRAPAHQGTLRWRIEEEGGRHHEGTLDAAALPETARTHIEGVLYCEREMELGVALPPGYHGLRVEGAEGFSGETLVVAAPERCYQPGALAAGGRVWGPAVQLYALRSERNWGIGDFGDLQRLVEDWAALGAGIIGLNPLHALYPHAPAHASPYSPSSRERLNVLYLDVEAIPDYAECESAQRLVRSSVFQARLARLRAAPLVDYPGVAAAKFEVLAQLHAQFRERHLAVAGESSYGRAFRLFQEQGGEALRRHALHEALQARLHAADPQVHGWQDWPDHYRDPCGEAVARFAATNAGQVEYFEYLQWQSERQLAQVGGRCAALGLAVGLYLDLAISADGGGSDAWSNQDGCAFGAGAGAPPDDFNPEGQDWGSPPYRPDRLRALRYAPLRHALAANMRIAGALRIDHVMSLMRLYWVPRGARGSAGAYVQYALDEQLAIVALESHRNRCLVVGEDLGTVPDEVRARLAHAGALSCRLLYFERRQDGEFKSGAEYPRDALVAVGTHDLPTLAGWWRGRDLEWWRDLGVCPAGEPYERRRAERARDRERLARALQRDGLLAPEPNAAQLAARPLERALAEAAHALLAGSAAQVMMVQLEDVLGEAEQANLPGTVAEHPNWRRKLTVTLEALRGDPRVVETARRLAALGPPRGARGGYDSAGARRDFLRTFYDARNLSPDRSPPATATPARAAVRTRLQPVVWLAPAHAHAVCAPESGAVAANRP